MDLMTKPSHAQPITLDDSTSFFTARPSLPRVATDQILDYYNSPEADSGRPYNQSVASASGAAARQSGMERFQKAPSSPQSQETSPPQPTRTRLHSAGGADNRRLHIIELGDAPVEPENVPLRSRSGPSSPVNDGPVDHSEASQSLRRKHSGSSNLLSRRGLDHGRLALVAPPDAAPSSYTNLSPPDIPQTAPVRRRRYDLGGLGDSDDGDESEMATREHRRTRSNLVEQGSASRLGPRRLAGRTSPRDGIVFFPPGDFVVQSAFKRSQGAFDIQSLRQYGSSAANADDAGPLETTFASSSANGLSPSRHPIPDSPPSQPDAAISRSPPNKRPAFLNCPSGSPSEKVITPNIGEEKDPMARVAAPVVVGLGLPDNAFAGVPPNDPYTQPSPQFVTRPTVASFPSSSSLSGFSSATLRPASTLLNGAASAPPPRPPRAVGSRRPLGNLIKPPTSSNSSQSITRPQLSTMDSDYSLVAVTVSSSSSSDALIPSGSGATMDTTISEISLPEEPRHRREAANNSPTKSQHTILICPPRPPSSEPIPTLPSLDFSSPPPLQSIMPPPAAAPPQSETLAPARPKLTSRWSSWSEDQAAASAAPSSDVSREPSPLKAATLDELVNEVESEMGSVVVMQTNEVAPLDPVEPPKERETLRGPRARARAGSRSPGLPRVEEGESYDSEEQMSHQTVSTPQEPSTPNLPAVESSSDLPITTPIDISSPVKGLPLAASEPISMAGIGSAAGRAPMRQSPPKEEPLPERRRSDSPLGFVSNIIPTSLKRRSTIGVPRSPSAFSFGRLHTKPASVSGHDELTPTRTRKKRRVGQVPDSMFCKDIISMKTPLERATGYAQRMKELMQEESGLGDWVEYAKSPGRRSGQNSKRASREIVASSSSSTHSSLGLGRAPSRAGSAKDAFTPHPRQVSHGSEASEATFPIRADAYTATELSSRNGSNSPPRGPPSNLPYPALAHNIGMRTTTSLASFNTTLGTTTTGAPLAPAPSTSMRSFKSPLSPKASGGGFFATIGRKASMKKDRPTLAQIGAPSPIVRVGSMGFSNLTSRPVNVSNPQARLSKASSNGSVIGGPRPLPSKGGLGRSNSLLASLGRRSTEKDKENDGYLASFPEDGPIDDTETVYGDSHQGHSNNSIDTGHDEASPRSDPARYSINGSSSGTSLVPRSSLSHRGIKGAGSPEDVFKDNLDKLVDVLPHVDRSVLANYLKRAGGEDLKAIGAYLEDEKNGVVISS